MVEVFLCVSQSGSVLFFVPVLKLLIISMRHRGYSYSRILDSAKYNVMVFMTSLGKFQ